jgi:hypothetical protein
MCALVTTLRCCIESTQRAGAALRPWIDVPSRRRIWREVARRWIPNVGKSWFTACGYLSDGSEKSLNIPVSGIDAATGADGSGHVMATTLSNIRPKPRNFIFAEPQQAH